MDLREVCEDQKSEYNKAVTHIMQSWEWGEFRQKLKTPLLRYGLYKDGKLTTAFQLTLHKVPFLNSFVGYLPKGPFPDQNLAQALEKIGEQHKCIFIKVEPDILATTDLPIDPNFKQSLKPMFTKHNFVLDLTKPENEILKNMRPKSRYNIKVAQKHGVIIEERTDDEAFEIYLKLYFETTKRQNYHGHNEKYHRTVWETLKKAGLATLLIAFYTPPGTSQKIPLTAWMLLAFKDTLYYPYGGSSPEYKNVMAPNLLVWEAIKLGKKLGLKKFDLWGSAGPNATPSHPWYGFHHFKEGLGGDLVEYLGTYDLIFNLPQYYLFNLIDHFTSIKVFLLKLVGRK